MVLTDEPPLYRDLMRLKPDALTPNAWAVRAGVSRTVWSDMRRHGNPSRRTLEKLLVAAGSSLAEFEALRIGEAPRPFVSMDSSGAEDARAAGWRPAPLPPVPLLATGQGGEWQGDGRIEWMTVDPDRVVGKVERPTSLSGDSNAYAVTVVGQSMWPRFRPGRKLLVSPAAPVAIGDDVLLRPTSAFPQAKATMAFIKELVRRTPDSTELRQFHPDATFAVEPSAIAAIHKIVGEAI